jgi:hypothetical protein
LHTHTHTHTHTHKTHTQDTHTRPLTLLSVCLSSLRFMHARAATLPLLPPPGLPSLLNALAFSPTILPRLWGRLGPSLGLPLEAPIGATRGLDIASLAHGFRNMPRGSAQALGLFCRCDCVIVCVGGRSERERERERESQAHLEPQSFLPPAHHTGCITSCS